MTTAWFSCGEWVELDQSWPEEVFKQLDWFNRREFREKSAVTAAPMFPPDTPPAQIAGKLRTDLQHMTTAGLLNESSPYVSEVLDLLRDWNPSARRTPKAQPQTEREKMIALILQFALGRS